MQRPCFDSRPPLLIAIEYSGRVMIVTPPAIATSHSPERTLRSARCVATRDALHAVSTARLGPWRSNAWEMRLASIAIEQLAAVAASARCRFGAPSWVRRVSRAKPPMKTPVFDPRRARSGRPASSKAS
jgi:hypothetical protein